jgi:hypothetical protein
LSDRIRSDEIEDFLDSKKAVDRRRISLRRNALRHSFCSYGVAITGDIPLVSTESGNSVQMIKRCYRDVKHFDEGLRWFGITLPISMQRCQEPFLKDLPRTSFSP